VPDSAEPPALPARVASFELTNSSLEERRRHEWYGDQEQVAPCS